MTLWKVTEGYRCVDTAFIEAETRAEAIQKYEDGKCVTIEVTTRIVRRRTPQAEKAESNQQHRRNAK